MSKATASSSPSVKVPKDLSNCSKSSFTLTFTIEIIIDLKIWSDHKEGWVDLGPCLQGLKLQYQLYYGQSFDVDIAVYQHVARISCGPELCWVRTWQFVERRWFTFSIRHAFPVKAMELRDFEAIVHVTSGSGASVKLDQQLFFPPLDFGQRRYFGNVVEKLPKTKDILLTWIRELIWNLVLDVIPPSHLDGRFNVPYPVADVRHQDTMLYKIQEEILNRSHRIIDENLNESPPPTRGKATPTKDKGKKGVEKKGFQMKLSGDRMLAGSGRLVAFEPLGEHPRELGEIMILLSSANLPAHDDVPVVFINVGRLFDVPLEELKKLNVSHLFTRWTLGDETHDSEHVDIESIKSLEVQFNDSHALPLNPSSATELTAIFLDNPFNIELRGVKSLPETLGAEPKLFGYEEKDRDFGTATNLAFNIEEEDQDFIIAVTKNDTRTLARGLNTFISGEYNLYPPTSFVPTLSRQVACTNDINLIRVPQKPKLIVPGHLVLSAQMTLEVSLGVVGCKPPKITSCFSRLFCNISDSNCIMEILVRIRKLNDEIAILKPNAMMTGFALDIGDNVILYLEGPRDGNILKIWDMSEEFYPKIKPVFSTSARFTTRLYQEFLQAMPFLVLKLYAPLALILACPSVYVRPALPIPARIAALKLGHLTKHRCRTLPSRCLMPTAAELRSFRLELCTPPRAYPFLHTTHDKVYSGQSRNTTSSPPGAKAVGTSRTCCINKINWLNN